jgi:hypothetical protein
MALVLFMLFVRWDSSACREDMNGLVVSRHGSTRVMSPRGTVGVGTHCWAPPQDPDVRDYRIRLLPGVTYAKRWLAAVPD